MGYQRDQNYANRNVSQGKGFKCPVCGSFVRAGYDYCPNCGEVITGSSSSDGLSDDEVEYIYSVSDWKIGEMVMLFWALVASAAGLWCSTNLPFLAFFGFIILFITLIFGAAMLRDRIRDHADTYRGWFSRWFRYVTPSLIIILSIKAMINFAMNNH
jgi:predicted RNA-binding Zn-ribbon protein involved in translation (DUF1610 family)